MHGQWITPQKTIASIRGSRGFHPFCLSCMVRGEIFGDFMGRGSFGKMIITL